MKKHEKRSKIVQIVFATERTRKLKMYLKDFIAPFGEKTKIINP